MNAVKPFETIHFKTNETPFYLTNMIFQVEQLEDESESSQEEVGTEDSSSKHTCCWGRVVDLTRYIRSLKMCLVSHSFQIIVLAKLDITP